MKAHKGSYVNKTNEKPILRGGGRAGEKVGGLLFVKSCSVYSHHGGNTKHLLIARQADRQKNEYTGGDNIHATRMQIRNISSAIKRQPGF